MTPKPVERRKRRRGRPRKEGTILTRVRLSEAVYDAYCKQALRTGADDVRVVIRRTLSARINPEGLTAQEARTVALALFTMAEEMDREAHRRQRNICAPKIAGIQG